MRLSSTVWMLPVAVCLFGAEDFWIARDADKWSEREIDRMVTDSPWAKEARVRLRGDSIPNIERGSHGGAVDEPQAGAVLQNRATSIQAIPHILVRWDSAPPVYEACSRGGMDRPLFTCVSKLLYLSALGNKFDRLRDDNYIVSMSNYPVRAGVNAPQHSEAATAALQKMAAQIQETTFLKRKGKSPAKPAHVVALPAAQTLLIIVFFSRTETLSISDKDVLFESSYGTLELSASFKLRRMTYQGKLTL